MDCSMFPENRYRNESDMKYPSLEPMDLENADPNATLPATRPSSKRSLNDEGLWKYPAPSGPPFSPTGLDLFTGLDHLFVDQKVEFLEAVTGLKFRNKYSVKNNLNQKVLVATEETNLCSKVIFGKKRDFIMRIYDTSMNEVLILKRAASCCICCIPSTLQKLEVYSPSEILLGSVEQEWNLFLPNFRINNETGECVLRMSGPFFASPLLCGDRDYEIYSKDKKSRIGKISKHWGGIIKEFYTDADNFGISFPMDLDIRMKAVLLGACFLIDFMFYER